MCVFDNQTKLPPSTALAIQGTMGESNLVKVETCEGKVCVEKGSNQTDGRSLENSAEKGDKDEEFQNVKTITFDELKGRRLDNRTDFNAKQLNEAPADANQGEFVWPTGSPTPPNDDKEPDHVHLKGNESDIKARQLNDDKAPADANQEEFAWPTGIPTPNDDKEPDHVHLKGSVQSTGSARQLNEDKESGDLDGDEPGIEKELIGGQASGEKKSAQGGGLPTISGRSLLKGRQQHGRHQDDYDQADEEYANEYSDGSNQGENEYSDSSDHFDHSEHSDHTDIKRKTKHDNYVYDTLNEEEQDLDLDEDEDLEADEDYDDDDEGRGSFRSLETKKKSKKGGKDRDHRPKLVSSAFLRRLVRRSI